MSRQTKKSDNIIVVQVCLMIEFPDKKTINNKSYFNLNVQQNSQPPGIGVNAQLLQQTTTTTIYTQYRRDTQAEVKIVHTSENYGQERTKTVLQSRKTFQRHQPVQNEGFLG